MLPEAELPLRVLGETAHFDFLGAQDEPWVQALLAEMQRFEGQRRRQLTERLAEPLPVPAHVFKRRAATRVLMRLWKPQPLSDPRPPTLREAVFLAAAAGSPRAAVLDRVARSCGLSSQELDQRLFADLPGERVVQAPSPVPTAAEVVLRTNLAIAQAALMRAAMVELRLQGASRAIVRLAKLRGLLCVVRSRDEDVQLEISGPFALFRHTLLYGRSLATMLPHLAWCARFALRARCALRGRLLEVTLDNTSPLFPAQAPEPFDSQLEARFARDLAALALDWDLLREPEPLPAGDTLIFPDFLLRHRIFPERRVFIELIGFWTPDYLAKKLERLAASRVRNLILCIDEERACGGLGLPPHLPVIRYRRKVNVALVLQAAERMLASPGGS